MTASGEATPLFKQVAKNLIQALSALHSQGRVHGNLKPVLIDITLDGQVTLRGPVIPIHATSATLSHSIDAEYSSNVFDLGKILFFCLTGRHQVARQSNMQDLVGMSSMPTEAHLINELVGPSTHRPSMQQALRHPCLWSDRQCADFLVSVSDYLKLMGKDNVGLPHQLHQRLQQALQKGTQLWSELVHAALMQELHNNFKGLQTDSWWHLLRCFRNLHNHHSQVYRDRPALRQSIGRTDVGAYRYFAARFPKLLIITYGFVQACCMEDPDFTSKMVSDVCMANNTPQAAAFKLNAHAECFTPSQAGCVLHGQVVPPQGSSRTPNKPIASMANTAQQASRSVSSAASAIRRPSYACVARSVTTQQCLPDSSASSEGSDSCDGYSFRSRVGSCNSSQESCDSHWSTSQSRHSRRRLNDPAVGSAGANSPNSLVTLQATAYNRAQRKAAEQSYQHGDRTALGAACIGRCYELGSGGFVRVAYALDWYQKAIPLCEEGAFKTYILMRITDLQQRPKRGDGQSG